MIPNDLRQVVSPRCGERDNGKNPWRQRSCDSDEQLGPLHRHCGPGGHAVANGASEHDFCAGATAEPVPVLLWAPRGVGDGFCHCFNVSMTPRLTLSASLLFGFVLPPFYRAKKILNVFDQKFLFGVMFNFEPVSTDLCCDSEQLFDFLLQVRLQFEQGLKFEDFLGEESN